MLETKCQENARAIAQQMKNSGGSGAGGINYSTTEQDTGLKWTDERSIYQNTYAFENAISLTKDSWTSTGVDAPGDKILSAIAYTSTGVFISGADINEGKIRLLNARANDAVSVSGMTITYVKPIV